MYTDNKRQAGYQAAFASKPACDGGVLGDVSFTGVHIRFCGNGGLLAGLIQNVPGPL